MEYVTPDYLEGNKTGQYQPETWLDEVVDVTDPKKVIQEGTPMDAEHFNHMEQGIHNNSLMLAILLENVKQNKQAVSAVDISTDDYKYHRNFGEKLFENYGSECIDMTKIIARAFILTILPELLH